MPTHDKTTIDDAHPSQAAAQQKPGSGITHKIGGVVNVIHGTGEIIRGHALEAGDFGRGDGKGREIIAAGRDEVDRGLNRIEGTATSATDHDQDWDRRGVDDGTGAAPDHDPNTPHTTAASRADPTSEKGRLDAADTRYLAERGTAGAAENGTHGPSPEQYHGEQTAATAPPPGRDPLSVANSPGGLNQPNTDVRQQGNGIASSDRGKETRIIADAAGQKQPSGTASQA